MVLNESRSCATSSLCLKVGSGASKLPFATSWVDSERKPSGWVALRMLRLVKKKMTMPPMLMQKRMTIAINTPHANTISRCCMTAIVQLV